MSTGTDKKAVVEFITDGVTIKNSMGRAVSSSDTGEADATNVLAGIRLNGVHSDSTGNSRELVILIGETAPTGKYVNAACGSLFILTGDAGGLYQMTSAGTWTLVSHG